jgi:hypothetical protein
MTCLFVQGLKTERKNVIKLSGRCLDLHFSTALQHTYLIDSDRAKAIPEKEGPLNRTF